MSLVDNYCPKLNCDIYQSDSEKYLFTLNQTDVTKNANKFFICQLLEALDGRAFFIYTRFGRLGYQGKWYIDCFLSKKQAIEAFIALFYNKTGQNWDARDPKQQVDGKYCYITMRVEESDYLENLKEQAKNLNVSLDIPVRNLIRIIFDPDHYRNVVKQFDLDDTKAPLGAISHSQIDTAYKVLALLSATIESKDKTKIAELSSEFYSIIPTSSGMNKLPTIDNTTMIDKKIELLEILDSMRELSKLRSMNDSENIKYLSLKCNICTVTNITELNKINTYFNNTNAHSHKMKILNCFKLNKAQEDSRFANLHNRQLLWHGSRIENFVSILSSGLKLKPGKVVRTGSMFGNGIYFANCSSKSAGYVGTTRYILMLLCEVALGNCYPLYNAQNIKQLPSGYHSVHGQGSWSPSDSHKIKLYNITMNAGNVTKNNAIASSCSLNYDEFIVYNENQIKLKYVLLIEK